MKKFKNSRLSTDSRKLQTLALKYLHANFAVLVEMTELNVDNSPLQNSRFKKSPLRAFSRGKFKSYFRTVG